MSWFGDLSSKVENLTSKVQDALPIDKATIQKLTLTTPELSEERRRIDQEERRKEQVKDALAGMLPWETRDDEREILVEECKEAIMALSGKNETFFGPYVMPPLPKVDEEDEDEEDEEEEEEKKKELQQPSEESLQKLAKLEPLPPLLAEFDLDSHVGLIQRLLKLDENLVEKQSTLSGGGAREKIFWRNYFFHCAFSRYEAGLNIDEIWSDERTQASQHGGSAVAEEESIASETITFESNEAASTPAPSPSLTTDKKSESDAVKAATASAPLFSEPARTAAGTATPPSVEGSDFDMVDEANDGGSSELDELEAEIARELED